jgi:hypothetical protein
LKYWSLNCPQKARLYCLQKRVSGLTLFEKE